MYDTWPAVIMILIIEVIYANNFVFQEKAGQ